MQDYAASDQMIWIMSVFENFSALDPLHPADLPVADELHRPHQGVLSFCPVVAQGTLLRAAPASMPQLAGAY